MGLIRGTNPSTRGGSKREYEMRKGWNRRRSGAKCRRGGSVREDEMRQGWNRRRVTNPSRRGGSTRENEMRKGWNRPRSGVKCVGVGACGVVLGSWPFIDADLSGTSVSGVSRFCHPRRCIEPHLGSERWYEGYPVRTLSNQCLQGMPARQRDRDASAGGSVHERQGNRQRTMTSGSGIKVMDPSTRGGSTRENVMRRGWNRLRCGVYEGYPVRRAADYPLLPGAADFPILPG